MIAGVTTAKFITQANGQLGDLVAMATSFIGKQRIRNDE
jgi:hypothetical protein